MAFLALRMRVLIECLSCNEWARGCLQSLLLFFSLCVLSFSISASANRCKDLPIEFREASENGSPGKKNPPVQALHSEDGFRPHSLQYDFVGRGVPSIHKSTHPSPLDGTRDLESYLGLLLERQIIEESKLVRFKEGLEEGKLVNPISAEEAWLSVAFRIHHDKIQRYLDETSLDKKELLDWSNAFLEEWARVRVRREETREETQSLDQKLKFHPVRPGRFEMGEGDHKTPVILTYPMEVQSTPVTQKHWVEIMGKNPSHFAKGEDSVVINIDGKRVILQPDHPVENVTWWSVLEFANRLSKEHGFEPAYDLSGIDWKPGTRAEDGTLDAKSGEVRIYVQGRSYNPYEGDIYYRVEGYRLLTEAEQEYMLRAAGQSRGLYSFGDNEADLKDHAWFADNSDGHTHPVGLLTALVIDSREFYDLHGNVREWGWSWRGEGLIGGKNPVGLERGSSRVIRGGSWYNGAEFVRSALRGNGVPGNRSSYVGFRLVRTAR